MMKISFACILVIAILTFVPISGFSQSCQTGYPHVAKKNGVFDSRNQDLWQIAQDWVHFRKMILKCNARGDKKGVAKYQELFRKANIWLESYSDDHIQKALSLAEECIK